MPNSLSAFANRLSHHVLLDEDDRSAILSLPVSDNEIRAGDYIVREGRCASACSILVSGFAYRQRTPAKETRQIIGLNFPGEALDVANIFLNYADYDVRALTDCSIAFVSRDRMINIIDQHPAVGRAILKYLLIDASISRAWMLNLGHRAAKVRVSHFLCEFALRLDPDSSKNWRHFLPQVTQVDIAAATGLTSVHVNRMLRSLENEKLIERHGRVYLIPDLTALITASNYESRYLHTRMCSSGGAQNYVDQAQAESAMIGSALVVDVSR